MFQDQRFPAIHAPLPHLFLPTSSLSTFSTFYHVTEQVDPQEKEPCAYLFPSFVPSFCFMWFVKIRYLSLLQYRIRAVLPHSKEVMGSGISGDCNWTDGWTDCVVPFKKWYRTCAHICQCQATTAMHTNNNNQGRVGAIYFLQQTSIKLTHTEGGLGPGVKELKRFQIYRKVLVLFFQNY